MTSNHFTTDDASRHAQLWCSRNLSWSRICDVDERAYVVSWSDLPGLTRRRFCVRYRCHSDDHGRAVFDEFGPKPLRFRFGFISGAGEFFASVCDVPISHNLMMVIQTNGPAGLYWRGGMRARSVSFPSR